MWDEYYKANKELVDKECPELVEYNPDFDYVGPNGLRFLKLIIPRTIYGVSINKRGFNHDRRYQEGGTEEDRLEADQEFEEGISEDLDGSWLRRFPRIRAWATKRAAVYYAAVLAIGPKCFNYIKGRK